MECQSVEPGQIEQVLDRAACAAQRCHRRAVIHALIEPAALALAVLGLGLYALLQVHGIRAGLALGLLVAGFALAAAFVVLIARLRTNHRRPALMQVAFALDDRMQMQGALITAVAEPRNASPVHNAFLRRVQRQVDDRLRESRLPRIGPVRRDWVLGYSSLILLLLALVLLFSQGALRDEVARFLTWTDPPANPQAPPSPVANAPESQPDNQPPPANGNAPDNRAATNPDQKDPSSNNASNKEEDPEQGDGDGGDGSGAGGTGDGQGESSDGTGDNESPQPQPEPQPQPDAQPEAGNGDGQPPPDPTNPETPTAPGEENGNQPPPDYELDPQQVNLAAKDGERRTQKMKVYTDNPDGKSGTEEVPLTDLLPRIAAASDAGRLRSRLNPDDAQLVRAWYEQLKRAAGR